MKAAYATRFPSIATSTFLRSPSLPMRSTSGAPTMKLLAGLVDEGLLVASDAVDAAAVAAGEGGSGDDKGVG